MPASLTKTDHSSLAMPTDHETPFRRQIALITVLCGLVGLLLITFGGLAITRFQAAETAWEEYNHRADAIGIAMVNLNRHMGYGGFIHNFKNLVLRRDLPRYQAQIERDIADLTADMDQLEGLFILQGNKQALAQLRTTLLEYADKYTEIASLVAAGKSSVEIDAVIKVDDSKAIAAMTQLISQSKERTFEAEKRAQERQAEAIHFLQLGGLVIFTFIVAALAAMIHYLRRIVAANDLIRQTQARLDSLLDHSPDPMLCVDPNGHIVRSNRTAEQFFGYGNAELLSMKIEQLIPERFRADHTEHRHAFFNHPKNRFMGGGSTLSALTRDGSEPSVEISLSHSGAGTERLATITIRDVTEQVRNRQALAEARHRAESALAQQQAMQDELVQAEKMAALGGMVAGVAHEINTPIGVALSSATYLEAETHKTDALYQAGELTEEGLNSYFATARQAVQLLVMNSQRASNLIHGFKQVAVDQTGGERRKYDLATYLNEVLLSLLPLLKKSSITVDVECPEDLLMDGFPGALSQVLTNLVMNSLFHAFAPDQTGHIHITARPADEKSEWVELVYRDNGKGIPPEHLDKVFEPFFTTRRGKGGSGLGLHIVFNIVHQTLKGTIRLDSPSEDGAVFTLRLPRTLPG